MFVKNLNIRLFQKKNKQGGGEGFGEGKSWGHNFLTPYPSPPEFLGFLLCPWKFQTKQDFTLETPQNCVTIHPSEILKPKTKTPGNSTLYLINAYLWQREMRIHLLAGLLARSPKWVLPFLTNQFAQFISCGDMGCFFSSENILLLASFLPAWFQDSS